MTYEIFFGEGRGHNSFLLKLWGHIYLKGKKMPTSHLLTAAHMTRCAFLRSHSQLLIFNSLHKKHFYFQRSSIGHNRFGFQIIYRNRHFFFYVTWNYNRDVSTVYIHLNFKNRLYEVCHHSREAKKGGFVVLARCCFNPTGHLEGKRGERRWQMGRTA